MGGVSARGSRLQHTNVLPIPTLSGLMQSLLSAVARQRSPDGKFDSKLSHRGCLTFDLGWNVNNTMFG